MGQAHLEKVIDVLLDNAIKFGGSAPMRCRFAPTGRGPSWRSATMACGIPADRLTAIFQPFERAVAKEHFGGLGLGLYVAKAIVDAHEGSIAVTSRPGEGATFVVRLPGATD